MLENECQQIVNVVIPSRFPEGMNLLVLPDLRRKLGGGTANGLVVELHAWLADKPHASVKIRDSKLIDFLKKLAERGTGHEEVYEGVSYEFIDSKYRALMSGCRIYATPFGGMANKPFKSC
jgi:hypothetical protein